jgi:hypothetical protein
MYAMYARNCEGLNLKSIEIRTNILRQKQLNLRPCKDHKVSKTKNSFRKPTFASDVSEPFLKMATSFESEGSETLATKGMASGPEMKVPCYKSIKLLFGQVLK